MRGQRKVSFVLLLASLSLLFALVGGTWNTAFGASQDKGTAPKPAAFIVPTFTIEAVQTDQSVTIKTYNFPANDTFTVLMNVIHTQGIGGYQVGTINSGGGGTFTATFNIPSQLKGQQQIAIRLESPTSHFFSYNWFWNNTSGVPVTAPTATPGSGATAVPGATVVPGLIPTFSISSVTADTSVSITTANFPANDTFYVLMNVIGTRGIGGYTIGTINSGAGGSFTATFNIPSQLKGQRQIAIRLESPTSGYFSYNWFWNNTTGGVPNTGGTPVPSLPPGVIPTFSIGSVTTDTSVSITTANFPANDTFNVLMNVIGTRGVGGYTIGTINSGAGGSFTATFNIPSQLKGQRQIAIRLESPTSGYFSYNWFWNNTTGGLPNTGGTPVPSLPPGVIPTISITGVTKDVSVTVATANFPANDTFTVYMGAFGTQGIGGTNVGTFNSGAGGALSGTFNIPASLQGQQRIAIRLVSATSGYYSYNWFWNNTFP